MTIRPFFQALIPAGVMAALVLFVFSTLQYYGPESAVRRFHEGIKSQDMELVNQVIVQPETPSEAKEIAFIENWLAVGLAQGYRFRLKALERSPDKVTFDVLYRAPNSRRSGNYPFVVQKTPSGWKVNIHQTLIKMNSVVPRSQITGQRIK